MANKFFLTLMVFFTPFMLYAAAVHTIKPNNGPIILNSEANTFTDLSQNLISSDTGSMLEFSAPFSDTRQIEASEPLKAPGTDKAKSFHQQLLLEYGDNSLVQDSLYSLYKAKHLWDDLDALAYEFSDEILYSLKFDQFIEVDLNKFQNPHTIKHRKVNKNIYNKVRRVQNSSKKRSSGNNQTVEDSILSHLFRKQTLYYLLALFLIISILAKAARFILGLFP